MDPMPLSLALDADRGVILIPRRRRNGSATPPALRNQLARQSGCLTIDDGRVAISCTYCGEPGKVWWEPSRHNGNRRIPARTFATLEVDHLIPFVKGGRHDLTNVTWSCAACNTRKGSRTVGEFLTRERGR